MNRALLLHSTVKEANDYGKLETGNRCRVRQAPTSECAIVEIVLECGHHGLERMQDEEKDCGYFRWIDPPILNKWYKERMYELGVVANGGVVIPFNNPVNEGEIPVDGPIAPVNVDVPIAPVNALEPDNQIAMRENTHVPGNEFGFCRWMMVCFVCFIVGMMYG
ncbi:unnamed protein product [Lactuca saligna]|uniref:Uncharacterized protein n=1 Tax=Lactuca saligna TaxID=75948 RepID=A0AA35VG58_LACSI|nr:unnamed protein product [Lactuca saligna]